MALDPQSIIARRISVRGIILHDGKLLCVKLKPYHGAINAVDSTSKSAGFWCLPGGGLDPEESLIDGVKREMLEETGIEAQVGNLLYIQQLVYKKLEYLEFFFHIANAQDYLDIDLSKSTHGETEIAEIGLIDPAAEKVLPEFLTTEPLTEVAAQGITKIFSHPGDAADKLLG